MEVAQEEATKIPSGGGNSKQGGGFKKKSEQEQEKYMGDFGTMNTPKPKAKSPSDAQEPVNAPGNKRKTKTQKKKVPKGKKDRIAALKVPKSSQDTIPYERVYKNGIFQSEVSLYTKTYELTDANFKTTTQDHQDAMYYAYGDLINYFQPDVRPQFTIFNMKIDKESFKEHTLYQGKEDGFDDYRHAMNDVLEDKISEGQNNIVQKKFLTVGVSAENIQVAANVFSRVDTEISPKIKEINEADTVPMTLVKRLGLLHEIYNQSATMPFYKKMEIGGEKVETFNIGHMLEMGLTTKDLIAPMDIQFYDDYFVIDDKLGRALSMRLYPTQLSADIMTDIANVPCTTLISVHFSPMSSICSPSLRLVQST